MVRTKSFDASSHGPSSSQIPPENPPIKSRKSRRRKRSESPELSGDCSDYSHSNCPDELLVRYNYSIPNDIELRIPVAG